MDTDKIYIAFLILLIISYFVLTYIFRNKKNDKVQSKKLNIFFVLYILFYIYFGFVNYKDNDNTLAVKTKLLRKLNNEKINDKDDSNANSNAINKKMNIIIKYVLQCLKTIVVLIVIYEVLYRYIDVCLIPINKWLTKDNNAISYQCIYIFCSVLLVFILEYCLGVLEKMMLNRVILHNPYYSEAFFVLSALTIYMILHCIILAMDVYNESNQEIKFNMFI